MIQGIKQDLDFQRLTEQAAKGSALLRAETDRGCALIGAAMLEETVGALLRAYLSNENGVAGALLDGPNAPLGTFSARIKLARALGLLQETVYRDLETIREIRNLAAHFDRRKDLGFSTGFSSEPVVARCRSLRSIPATWPDSVSPRLTFEVLVGMFAALFAEHAVNWKLVADNAGHKLASQLMREGVPAIDFPRYLVGTADRLRAMQNDLPTS